MATHILYEAPVGYALFSLKEFPEVGQSIPDVQRAVKDRVNFTKTVKLVSFKPFLTAEESLDNINMVSEGSVSDTLESFLSDNLKTTHTLGVVDSALAQNIKELIDCKVNSTAIISEILRGIRENITAFINGLTKDALIQAGGALGHAYSRAKVKFNINRVDHNIMQTININDQMDKDINTFAMRLKEWYGYHFPELKSLVPDSGEYAQVVKLVQSRDSFTEDKIPQLVEILKDDTRAEDVAKAAKMSMGMDLAEGDVDHVNKFADRVINLYRLRKGMGSYLSDSMSRVAPNLGTIVGDQIGARLINHAGSLNNLSKLPASTIQILGAEKALFRALKKRSNQTPKYGIIFNTGPIAKANGKDKGRMARFLANKCAMACRIDNFSEHVSPAYGNLLKKQIEDRMEFYSSGTIPQKNEEVMLEAKKLHQEMISDAVKEEKNGSSSPQKNIELDNTNGHHESPKKKKKKKKNKDQDETLNGDESLIEPKTEEVGDETEQSTKKKKRKRKDLEETLNGDESIIDESEPKKKKKKKNKEDANVTIACPADVETETPKKKKKKSRQSL